MCARIKSLQPCPTLCDPKDCSPPAPLSRGFSRQEHWSGLPCSPPGDLPHPGMEPRSPVLAGGFSTTESPGKPPLAHLLHTGVLLLTSFFGGASQVVLVVKTLPADAGDMTDAGSIPGWGRSPGGGNGNPLQYSCWGNPMDRGA